MRRHLRSAILVSLFVVSGVVTRACDWWNGRKPRDDETAPAQGVASSPPVRLSDQALSAQRQKERLSSAHGVYGSATTMWKTRREDELARAHGGDDTSRTLIFTLWTTRHPSWGNLMTVDEEVSNIESPDGRTCLRGTNEVVFLA